MPTYKQIRNRYKRQFGMTIKDCWIADVKRELGLTIRIAYNRLNEDEAKCKCPEGEIKTRIRNLLQ